MKTGGAKGRKIVQRNRFVNRPPDPLVIHVVNASHHLAHSPLSNVHDVFENPVFKQAKENTKSADEQHKAAQE